LKIVPVTRKYYPPRHTEIRFMRMLIAAMALIVVLRVPLARRGDFVFTKIVDTGPTSDFAGFRGGPSLSINDLGEVGFGAISRTPLGDVLAIGSGGGFRIKDYRIVATSENDFARFSIRLAE
jgi:hypothetical protein